MQAILDAITRVGAKRLVIDSLVGFEMALAPGFRADFRESLYRMIGALTGAGITILSTVEIEDSFTSLQFSHYAISFLTDDIIRLRYVEIDGQLRKTHRCRQNAWWQPQQGHPRVCHHGQRRCGHPPTEHGL